MAFIYAISSAGVVHTLARACSQGELDSCSCDPAKKGSSRDAKGSFSWGGCSDHVDHAMRFSQAFVDAKERKGRDARALMNLHNNRAGRRVRGAKGGFKIYAHQRSGLPPVPSVLAARR